MSTWEIILYVVLGIFALAIIIELIQFFISIVWAIKDFCKESRTNILNSLANIFVFCISFLFCMYLFEDGESIAAVLCAICGTYSLYRFSQSAKEYTDLQKKKKRIEDELFLRQASLEELLNSNLSAYPHLAGVIADYLTYEYEILAKKLDWGSNVQREKKVKSIREIRASAKEQIKEAKEAVYQLEYLKALYPQLNDVLETNYKDLEFKTEIPDYDPIRDYISKEEWKNLSESERNQRALDNYIQSRHKTKWQIGRDYELYIGYRCEEKGYLVEYFGSFMGIEDLGRDLIVKNKNQTYIVQCKFWSQSKEIHEKHVYQLYGTLVSFCIENKATPKKVAGVFVTNIELSKTAQKAAEYLGIQVFENITFQEFPRIKCNLGKDEYGCTTRIYHLPMDQQYDKVKLVREGEFMALTVAEAEQNGFRRCYKWHGRS